MAGSDRPASSGSVSSHQRTGDVWLGLLVRLSSPTASAALQTEAARTSVSRSSRSPSCSPARSNLRPMSQAAGATPSLGERSTPLVPTPR
ncbi:hypothetical protein BDW75DRAFT_219749 [Aspergillus navahoensis]